jgi:isoamylase
MSESVEPGKAYPLGAAVEPDGVNFSVYSKHSLAIDLLLFDTLDATKPSRVISLDPRRHRTYHYWHVFVPCLKPGQLYGYRAVGPIDPGRGWRFAPAKVLLDPYGRAVALPSTYRRRAASRAGDNAASAMKSVVADPHGYDWEGDAPINRPYAQTVIYEMHVAGFTRDPSSGVERRKRGTYAGLIEKIPYLQDLGVTAVELLPVFQFDAQDAPAGLVNYWGYSPVSFFAPHAAYSSRRDPLGPLHEFRDMVKALHRAGMEVILDVVYNHTAEGDHTGPTFCFRGLANDVYYILEKDRSRYANYTGTGNTLNANHPIVRRMIGDSLRYWVEEMHIDGFRFDLASILSRDETGQPLENPPVLWDIESDPVLAGTKLIAEAWDAAGLYQVGTFVGDSWKEWNGRFRDDVRSFVRGDKGTVSKLAARLLASPDLYADDEREPERSINFVTCHDGFTLNDLVSYNRKHNEANRQANRDGFDENRSWNCGVEGPTDDEQIEQLRVRQIKNFLVITLLALGTPMLLMGDEVRRTQRGNNNAYCQDNDISWLDWTLLEKNDGLKRFVKQLIHYRLHRHTPEHHSLTLNQLLHRAQVQWHGVKLNQPDWSYDSHSLAFSVQGLRGRLVFHFMMNAYWDPLDFELPAIETAALEDIGDPDDEPRGGLPDVPSAQQWRRWVDTSLESPDDICSWNQAPVVQTSTYRTQSRSIAVLVNQTPG